MSEHLERIDEFVAAVKQNNACYVLSDDKGLLIAESQFQVARDALLLWSDETTAKEQLKAEWQSFNVITIDSEDLADLLSHLSEDDILVGLDLTEEQIAIEIEANELLVQLSPCTK